MALKLWEKSVTVNHDVERYTVGRDREMDMYLARYDVLGSLAHIAMLESIGLLTSDELAVLTAELRNIYAEIEAGKFAIEEGIEDVHSEVELLLTQRLGDVGKKIHSGRSRNDQVLVDLRLFTRSAIEQLVHHVSMLFDTLIAQSEKYKNVLMPGYTHLQRAQPITFGHHLLAYGEMFLRDLSRLKDCKKRMNVNPLGSCALAGTTYPIDRHMTSSLLGFDAPTNNSLDGVSDRDYCLEIASDLSIIMVHLSRFSEEMIMWCSWEFKFVELDDAFSTGSSIMPQKKNPDIAELVRGKSGRVFGDTMSLLTAMKGIALAYNKDMQEDKEAIFDAVDSVKMCLISFTPMLDTMTVLKDKMRNAAAGGFINATDCADYLTKKGVPFRDAYKATGALVARCIDLGTDLENLPLEEYKNVHPTFDEGVYEAINLEKCVADRTSFGGPAPKNVLAQAEEMLKKIQG